MPLHHLINKRVAIWGAAREGLAAARLIRAEHPAIPLVIFDEAFDLQLPEDLQSSTTLIQSRAAMIPALGATDVVVKSPGVSLYDPLVANMQSRGIAVTSLLNLWFELPRRAKTICVTGTKGKSTTASAISLALKSTGATVELVGNIGTPLSPSTNREADFVVIEVSSYQAADFNGLCDVGVLTSLFPEHLDWHGTIGRYYQDKLNLLRHSSQTVVNTSTVEAIEESGMPLPSNATYFNSPTGFHVAGTTIYRGKDAIGRVRNSHLARPHNLSNVCAALATMPCVGIEPHRVLAALNDFVGLPHRQQELGVCDDVLFVDDSISTTPESTLAAVTAYKGRATTIVLGGHDRGLDFRDLLDRLASEHIVGIICMGQSGKRIGASLVGTPLESRVHQAASMEEAVAIAKAITPPQGVVLLSPASPSYGQYKNYIERGRDFAKNSGFVIT